MRLRKIDILAALGLVLTLVGPAAAGAIGVTTYIEAVNGDFSGGNLTPTVVAFGLGQNEIIGTTGAVPAGNFDRDYFTFTIPAFSTMTSLTLLSTVLGSGPLAFIGIERGPIVTFTPAEAVARQGELLAWAHFAPANSGHDILPLLWSNTMGLGFQSPLGAGQYTAWIQDTSPGTTTYDMVFNVQAVPEPGSVLLTLTGLAAVLAGVRRRRR